MAGAREPGTAATARIGAGRCLDVAPLRRDGREVGSRPGAGWSGRRRGQRVRGAAHWWGFHRSRVASSPGRLFPDGPEPDSEGTGARPPAFGGAASRDPAVNRGPRMPPLPAGSLRAGARHERHLHASHDGRRAAPAARRGSTPRADRRRAARDATRGRRARDRGLPHRRALAAPHRRARRRPRLCRRDRFPARARPRHRARSRRRLRQPRTIRAHRPRPRLLAQRARPCRRSSLQQTPIQNSTTRRSPGWRRARI
jgi:hypothetical protein